MPVYIQIMMYYDKYVGVPQYGLFVTSAANEADQEFVPNEAIQDFMDQTGIRSIQGMAAFMGRIPRILAN